MSPTAVATAQRQGRRIYNLAALAARTHDHGERRALVERIAQLCRAETSAPAIASAVDSATIALSPKPSESREALDHRIRRALTAFNERIAHTKAIRRD